MANNKTLKWMACCAVLVGSFEGLALTAYPDKLAGGLPTVCYGETEGVILGTTYTKAECTEMLANKLPRYWAEIEPCIHVETTDNEKIAYTSFAYNVGSAAFCKSTTARLLNSGDHVGACQRLAMYNRTKSKGVVQGLTNRRSKETAICLAMKPVGPVAPKPPVVLPSAPAAPHVPVCTRWWFFWKVCK
jgi:lysozyme